MPEENKHISIRLDEVLDSLPENMQAELVRDFTNQAIGAKKICDMAAKPGE